jgi:hypothetical protein
MAQFNCWSKISLNRHQNCVGLPYLMSVNKYVKYKPRYEPGVDNIGRRWYESLENKFPLTYKPTAPTPESGINSFREFERNYGEIDHSLMDIVDEWMEKLMHSMDPSEVYTDDEVKVHMVKTTSSGFPFKGPKRNYIFHERWDDHIKMVEKILDENNDPFCWSWAQKYELRSQEKIDLGKIRGFCVSPVDHCFLQSRYYADFNENFFELSKDKNFPSAVGMSKFNQGFHNLALNLLKYPNIYYSDFSKFDTTMTPQMLYSNFLLKMKNIRLRPDQRRQAEKLMQSVIFSKVVLEDGSVHIKEGGNPSGQSNTIVDNTLTNIKLFLLSFLLTALETGNYDKANLRYFRNNVFLKCYGDDAILSISDELNEWFNGKIIENKMDLFGFIIKINHEPCSILEAEFLSHHFVKFGDLYLPMLDEEKILSSLVLGAYNDNALFNLMRALSLRIESWPSVKCRAIIKDYIHYCYSECSDDLQGFYLLAEDQRIDLESLKDLWFTDGEIFNLYAGYEGGNVLNKFSHF